MMLRLISPQPPRVEPPAWTIDLMTCFRSPFFTPWS